MAPDAVSVGVEGHTLAGDGFVQIGEAAEVPVDDRLVEMDPERLDRLELGGVGRQVDEAEALGHGQIGWAVPAGVIEDEQDDTVPAGARLPGEEGEHILEVALGDAGREIPEALAGLG